MAKRVCGSVEVDIQEIEPGTFSCAATLGGEALWSGLVDSPGSVGSRKRLTENADAYYTAAWTALQLAQHEGRVRPDLLAFGRSQNLRIERPEPQVDDFTVDCAADWVSDASEVTRDFASRVWRLTGVWKARRAASGMTLAAAARGIHAERVVEDDRRLVALEAAVKRWSDEQGRGRHLSPRHATAVAEVMWLNNCDEADVLRGVAAVERGGLRRQPLPVPEMRDVLHAHGVHPEMVEQRPFDRYWIGGALAEVAHLQRVVPPPIWTSGPVSPCLDRVVVTERAVDALSYHQLYLSRLENFSEEYAASESEESIRYLSTRGPLTGERAAAVAAELERIVADRARVAPTGPQDLESARSRWRVRWAMDRIRVPPVPPLEIVGAFGNTREGTAAAEALQCALPPGVTFAREAPSQGREWNDSLQWAERDWIRRQGTRERSAARGVGAGTSRERERESDRER